MAPLLPCRKDSIPPFFSIVNIFLSHFDKFTL